MARVPKAQVHKAARTVAVGIGALLVVLLVLYAVLLWLQAASHGNSAAVESDADVDQLAILASLAVDDVPSLDERDELLSTLSASHDHDLSVEQKLELLESLHAGL